MTQNLYLVVFILAVFISEIESAQPVPDLWEIPGLDDPDPTHSPTVKPTMKPTLNPSNIPSKSPSSNPTVSPTDNPSISPIKCTTPNPTTWSPTQVDETRSPTKNPTINPTKSPTTLNPTLLPTTSTYVPSNSPTPSPTIPLPIFTTELSLQRKTEEAVTLQQMNTSSKSESLAFIVIPTQAVSLLTVFVLFIASMYYFNLCPFCKSISKEDDGIISSIKISVLLTFLCNITGIICCIGICYILQTATRYDRDTYNKAVIIYYTLVIAYCFGKCCLETFFMMRLYFAFKDSTFELKNRTVIILCVWMWTVSGLWCYLFAADDQSIFGTNYILFIVLEVFEALLIITLIYLFTVRLQGLIISSQPKVTEQRNMEITSSQSPSISPRSILSTGAHKLPSVSQSVDIHKVVTENNKDRSWRTKAIESVRLNLHQSKLMFVITRCMLLSAVSLFTTTGFTVFVFYRVKWRTTNMMVLYVLWSVDMATNCVCLFLNFKFADNVYKKCCGLCHSVCQKATEYRTSRRILQDV